MRTLYVLYKFGSLNQIALRNQLSKSRKHICIISNSWMDGFLSRTNPNVLGASNKMKTSASLSMTNVWTQIRELEIVELDFEFEFELDFEFEFELIFSQFFTIIVFDYCLYRYTIIFYIIDPTWVYISAVLIFNRMREAKQTWQDAPMLTRSKPRTIPFQNESSKWPNSDPNWFNDYDIIIFPPLSWTSVLLSNDSSCDKSIDCSVRSLCSASPCYLRKI